jgi:hypothetical protein
LRRAASCSSVIGGRAELALVQRDEVAQDALVELERALELGEHLHVGQVELGDDVVAVLAALDRVRQGAAAPVLDADVAGGAQQPVVAGDLVVDGGVFERTVEDVDRLVRAGGLNRHGGNPPCGRGPAGAAARRAGAPAGTWVEPPPAGCRRGRRERRLAG